MVYGLWFTWAQIDCPPLTSIMLIPKSTDSAVFGRKSNQIDEMDLYSVLVAEVYVTGTVVFIILSLEQQL